MSRNNHVVLGRAAKARRRDAATVRQAEWDALTIAQRLERLRNTGHGHTKCAKKLEAKVSGS